MYSHGHYHSSPLTHPQRSDLPQINYEDALEILDRHNMHPRGIDAIQPGLYLGDLISAKKAVLLEERHITHIVSVCNTDDVHYAPNIKRLQVSAADSPSQNLLDEFPQTTRFIEDALDSGGRVFVHCEQGISRSPTVVAAYLMKAERLHTVEALAYIRKRRPIIDPNAGFIKQLHGVDSDDL